MPQGSAARKPPPSSPRAAPPASRSPQRRSSFSLALIPGLLLTLCFVAIAVLVCVAIALDALTGSGSPSLPMGAALGVSITGATLLCLASPLLLDRWITRAYRRIDSSASGMWLRVTATWNVIVALLAGVAIPSVTRHALEAHGDWMVGHQTRGAAASIRRSVLWVASRLPGGHADANARVVASNHAVVAHDAGAPLVAGATDAGSSARDAAAPAVTIVDHDLAPDGIFRLRADSVVVIHARLRRDENTMSARFLGISAPVVSGSGFIVDTSGSIVTNEHVVHDADSIEVRLRDGRTLTPVTVLAIDRAHDLALLGVTATGLVATPVASDDAVAIGMRAVAIGSPLGLDYSLTDGMVSAIRDLGGATFLQIQTTIAPGSSGGPLFDVRGRVIGVTTATEGQGLNFALHPRYVRELLTEPRAPHVLAAFEPQSRTVDVTLRPVVMSPVERIDLDSALPLAAIQVEGCAARLPRAGHLRINVTREAHDDVGVFGDQTVHSDLGRDGEHCLGERLQLVNMHIIAVLRREHAAELSSGTIVEFRYRVVSGVDAHAKTLDVLMSLDLAVPDAGPPVDAAHAEEQPSED